MANYGGAVSGATLQQAAANAIAGAESSSGANAATFRFGSDFYMVADLNGGGFRQANDVLTDIKGTSSLSRNDFI